MLGWRICTEMQLAVMRHNTVPSICYKGSQTFLHAYQRSFSNSALAQRHPGDECSSCASPQVLTVFTKMFQRRGCNIGNNESEILLLRHHFQQSGSKKQYVLNGDQCSWEMAQLRRKMEIQVINYQFCSLFKCRQIVTQLTVILLQSVLL